jgi:tricorn protease
MRANIWEYDIKTKQSKQLTKFKDFDVHFPSIGPKDMVFEAGGKLYLMDLATHNYKEVKIQVVTDLSSVKPRKENVQRYLQGASIAPDGNRVVVQARGELFSVPAEKGYVENMTQSSGAAERSPSWSPNGRYIAYWSDKSGEYELTIRDLKENGKERKVTTLGPGFRYSLFWSPDNKKVAFIDQTMTIYSLDIESGKASKVDQDIALLHGGLMGWSASWSPDSQWLAYAKTLKNGNAAIFMYDAEAGETTQVTSGFYSDGNPSFDPKGEYLYLTTNRSFTPVYGNFDNTWTYPNATQLAAIALKSATASPIAAENDETTIKEEEEKEDEKDEKGEEKEEDKGDTSENGEEEEEEKETVEFEDFERRLIVLPVPAGNMGSVRAAEGKVLYMRYPASGSQGMPSLRYYDMKDRKEQTIMEGVMGYDLSADGSKILVMQGGRLGVIKTAPGQKLEKSLPLDKMEMMLEPRKEWVQIFNDAWRFERYYFYDKGLHGVDWDAMRKQYGDLINHAVSRSDVNFILGELIGELNASHTYRGGGDQEMPKRKRVGYLGVDWAMENGHFKVKKIIRGAPWDNEVISPLDAPGIDVNEGDFILAVNGISLNSYADPWGAFEGMANETVELLVNNTTSTEDARTVLVKTLSDETRLRHLAWINHNRTRVMEASNGKIGYVYVPSTGIDGQNELVRQFMGQWHLPGLIIDERFNNGGQIPDRFIELLNRKPLAFWDVRDGQTWQWPPVAHFGPKAMLINGWSGSGGDAFPDYFRKSGLGPLVGSRTWGGLIGISGAPSLIDNGMVTVPTFRMFDPDGEWFREGHGVDPDIEVVEHPTALAKGIDPQLEAAIENVLMQIEKEGNIKPKTPKRENR